jgi:hypothetical protein
MIQILQERLDRSGYDVGYIDGAGLGALGVSTGPPIDPRTGLQWTNDDWISDMIEVTHRIRASVSAPLWTNGVGDAKRYYNLGSNRVVPEYDRGFTEQYTRHSMWGVDQHLVPLQWVRTQDMTREIGSKYAAITKVWVDASQEEKDRWHRHALTTFLMSAAPGAMYYFTGERATTVTPFHPYWRLARSLGAPTAETYALGPGNLASRPYELGIAVCNPTRKDITWTADQAYRGVAKGQQVLIQSYDGLMLHVRT